MGSRVRTTAVLLCPTARQEGKLDLSRLGTAVRWVLGLVCVRFVSGVA